MLNLDFEDHELVRGYDIMSWTTPNIVEVLLGLGSSLLIWRTSGSCSEEQIGIASVPIQISKYKLQGFSFCSAVFCKKVPVSNSVLKINPSLNPVGIASVPVQIANYKLQGLSEPTPMTAPVPFWMEGNSSIDFGFANYLQQFHFTWVLKKSPFS